MYIYNPKESFFNANVNSRKETYSLAFKRSSANFLIQ